MDEPMQERAVDEAMLDGNAVAGTLATIFGVDVTSVPGRCAHCGSMSQIGSLRAYIRAPGAVLRCGVCGQVVLRVVETVDATYMDARGAAFLRFERRG